MNNSLIQNNNNNQTNKPKTCIQVFVLFRILGPIIVKAYNWPIVHSIYIHLKIYGEFHLSVTIGCFFTTLTTYHRSPRTKAPTILVNESVCECLM